MHRCITRNLNFRWEVSGKKTFNHLPTSRRSFTAEGWLGWANRCYLTSLPIVATRGERALPEARARARSSPLEPMQVPSGHDDHWALALARD